MEVHQGQTVGCKRGGKKGTNIRYHTLMHCCHSADIIRESEIYLNFLFTHHMLFSALAFWILIGRKMAVAQLQIPGSHQCPRSHTLVSL